jgi:antitoxin Xre/MbcA/ParS-like protein
MTGSEAEVVMALSQYSDNGFFAPGKIAAAFRTTSEEVARTAGLGKDAVQRKDRVRSNKTQRRLREMIEIVNKVEPRLGSALMAYAWYRSEALPGFSGQTAMQLVRSGRADEVLDYIDAVDAGIHA